MEGLVAGQIALVTGGGRGLGRGICLELARHGADLVVADLDGTTAAAVAEEVRGLGQRAASLAADAATTAGRQAMVEAATALGPLDILVNNAGIFQVADPFTLSEADWDRMLNINTKAVFFLSQLVLPGMIERRRGSVINIASTAGKNASGTMAAHYNASKAAVIAITKTWARIAAPHGVRVNSVCPGYMDTPMWTMIDREMGALQGKAVGQLWSESVANVPLGRGGTPTDVGQVTVFLASGLAAYMTGQAINVSGGLVTH